MISIVKKNKKTIVLYSAVVFILISIAILTKVWLLEDMTKLDIQVSEYVSRLHMQSLLLIMIASTYLGNTEIVIAFLAMAVCVCLISGYRREAVALAVSVAATMTVTYAIKFMVDRARPESMYGFDVFGAAFPSAHAAAGMVLYGFFAYFLGKRFFPFRIPIYIASGAVIFLVGISRVYLGVHWMSDVIMGWCIGGAMLYVLAHALRKSENTAL